MTTELPTLPSIEDINKLTDKSEFSKSVYLLFEPVPDLINPLFDQFRPFKSYDELIDRTQSVIGAVSNPEVKRRILAAHPRLGGIAPSSNESDIQAESIKIEKEELSLMSQQEQRSHEQDEITDRKLALLNRRYEDKFNFKFVEFVNGRKRSELLPIFEKRLNENTAEQEMQIGLQAMVDIARARLAKLLK